MTVPEEPNGLTTKQLRQRALHILAKRELARRRLIDFTTLTMPAYEVGWVHRDLASRLEKFAQDVVDKKSPRLMVAMPPRIGKALHVDTEILTTTGFKPISAVKVNDYVYTENGVPTRVVAVSDVFKDRPLYRVTDELTGSSVLADGEHEWTLLSTLNPASPQVSRTPYTVSTHVLAMYTQIATTAPLVHLSLPRAAPLDHTHHLASMALSLTTQERLVADPYTLGIALAVTVGIHTPSNMREHAQSPTFTRTLEELRELTVFYPGVTVRDVSTIADLVLALDEPTRLSIVQGIVDTAGHLVTAHERNALAVPDTSHTRRLITALLRSLGKTAFVSPSNELLLFDKRVTRRAEWQVRLPACGEPSLQELTRSQRSLSVTARVDPTQPRGDTRCIMVDNPTHLYLAGHELMVTHNSELASIRFPAWFMGKHPHLSVISTSYSSDLPFGFSRKIRAMFRDEAFRAIFPDAELSPDSQAVERWVTTKGGEYVASGMTGGLTGKGCNILCIDDPLKNMEEADNAKTRANLLDWYQSTAYTRLAPGGGVLIINTRWHFDDLSGKLLAAARADEQADQFEVIDYPAIAEYYEYNNAAHNRIERYPERVPDGLLGELGLTPMRAPGEVLHPERFSPAMVQRFKQNLHPRIWSALYQQQPTPDEGLFFRKEYLITLKALPALAEGRVFTTWDFAISEKTHNDWTVGFTSIQDSSDVLYGHGLMRFKRDTYGIVTAIIDTAEAYMRDFGYMDYVAGLEDGHIYRTMMPVLRREMERRRVYFTIVPLTPNTDKIARARPLQSRMEMQAFMLLETMPRLSEAISELLQFPAAAHDDITDAMAWNARLALEYQPVAPVRRSKPAKSWKSKLSRIAHGDIGFLGA